MKVNIDEIKALPQQRTIVSFKEQLEGLEAVKPVLGELTLSTSCTGLKIIGQVQTLLKLNCRRCASPYFYSLTVPIEEHLVDSSFLAATQASERGNSRKNEKLVPLRQDSEVVPEDGLVDLSTLVYQAVTLATPTNGLCKEDCPGSVISSSHQAYKQLSGTAKNKSEEVPIDPRWKNLKSLLGNGESEPRS